MTLETGFMWQPTNTALDITEYKAAADHVAAEQGGVIQGEPLIVYPDQFDDMDAPVDMRVGVPLLRWTWIKQEANE